MSGKTSMTLEAVGDFLNARCSGDITDLAQMVEGESSQTFSFKHEAIDYVMRVNPSIVGFQKDDYAYQHFHSDAIPIPPVRAVGQIDAAHAFCIAEKLPGITLQDCDVATITQVLEPTFAVWQAISAVDITATTGFGYFDADGVGQFDSWGHYLATVLDPDTYDWDLIALHVDSDLLDATIARFTALIALCPEDRALVHGDFGANNVLADGHVITAILDWDCAKYGDPLYDVATVYFWRPWLACMDRQADYFATRLDTLPRYHERIACYQLRIGLAELYEAVIAQEAPMIAWLERRCTAILKGNDNGRA